MKGKWLDRVDWCKTPYSRIELCSTNPPNRFASFRRLSDFRQTIAHFLFAPLVYRLVRIPAQRGLVDECKSLEETTAGAAVNWELARIKKEVQLELQQLKEIRGALKDSDREIQDIRRSVANKMEKLRAAEE